MQRLSAGQRTTATSLAQGATGLAQELETVVVEELAGLDGLRAEWDELAVANRRPYCAPAWMVAWWQAADRPGAELRVLAAFDRGRLVGVAPFYVTSRPGRAARYRLLAAEASPRVEPLAAPGRRGAVAAAFAVALAHADPVPDVLAFDGIPAASPWPRLLADAWPSPGNTRVSVERSRPAPTAALRGITFEGWLASRSRNFRSQIRRARRDLEAVGGHFRVSGSDDVERDLAAFARLHHARWNPRGGSDALSTEVERMLPRVAHELAADERFRLWCMEVDGEVVCAHLHLVAGGEVAWWLGGFDDRFASLHPSLLALTVAIENGIARGEQRFDLGSGGQPFKYRFSDAEDRLDWVTLLPPMRRRALTLLERAPERMRARAAGVFSKRLKEQVRSVTRR